MKWIPKKSPSFHFNTHNQYLALQKRTPGPCALSVRKVHNLLRTTGTVAWTLGHTSFFSIGTKNFSIHHKANFNTSSMVDNPFLTFYRVAQKKNPRKGGKGEGNLRWWTTHFSPSKTGSAIGNAACCVSLVKKI